MLIKVTAEQMAAAAEFAEKCVPSVANNYAIRGQKNTDKIRTDIYIGKLGEFASYNALLIHFPNLQPPDLNIYKGRRKTHGADLHTECGTFKFAVKTQTIESVEKYGNSYLLERNSIEKFRDQMFVVCLYMGDNRVWINGIFTFAEFTENPGQPKIAWLKSKAAFYIEDIMVRKIHKNKQNVE